MNKEEDTPKGQAELGEDKKMLRKNKKNRCTNRSIKIKLSLSKWRLNNKDMETKMRKLNLKMSNNLRIPY